MKKNLGTIDRLLRIILAEIFLLAALYWLAYPWVWVAYVLAFCLFLMALLGYSPIYRFGKINTVGSNPSRPVSAIIWFIIFLLPVGGGLGSNWLVKQIFFRDASRLNEVYERILHETASGRRDQSVKDYKEWLRTFVSFGIKYRYYQPLFVRSDKVFLPSIVEVADITDSISRDVYHGSLQEAHDQLESIAPLVSGFISRNK